MNTSTPAVEKYQIGYIQRLKAVRVYDPQKNVYHSAILDMSKKVIIGFDDTSPYYPVGGYLAVNEIVQEKTGIVPKSTIFGFECWRCHDDVYRLGQMP